MSRFTQSSMKWAPFSALSANRTPRLHRMPTSKKEPRYDPAEIYGIISHDKRIPHDTREVLMRLVDDSYFQEFKAL